VLLPFLHDSRGIFNLLGIPLPESNCKLEHDKHCCDEGHCGNLLL
jgi:hypothetical protein